MKYIQLYLLFVFYLPAIFGASSTLVWITENKYETFFACLKKFGVPNSSIVRRSNSGIYNRLNYQWQLKGIYKKPLAILVVRNEADVVAVVQCGTKARVHIIPKGGGLSFVHYSSGNSTTVVVDVRKLKVLKVNNFEMSATVGAGWLIGPLLYEIWKQHKVFIPSGICPTSGIPGLATAGGFGHFTRSYGLMLDNLLEVNIVTANGALLVVSNTQNSDLYWALRGAHASNFGIVTKFVFKIYKVPRRVFYERFIFNKNQFVEVFDSWQRYTQAAPKSLSHEMYIRGNGETEVVCVDPEGISTNCDAIASKFPTPPKKITQTFKYSDFLFFNLRNLSEEHLNVSFNSLSDLKNLKREDTTQLYEKRKSFYVSTIIQKSKIGILAKYLAQTPDSVTVFFVSYGGSINNFLINETAFVHRGNTLYLTAAKYQNYKPNKKENKIGIKFVVNFFKLGRTLFNHNESYQNYVDGSLSDYLQRYYGSNLKRLVQIKRKYDAFNYFSNPQSIPTHIE